MEYLYQLCLLCLLQEVFTHLVLEGELKSALEFSFHGIRLHYILQCMWEFWRMG